VHREQISELYRQHKNRTICNSTKHVKSSVTSQNTHDKSSTIVNNMDKLNKEHCRLMKECVYIFFFGETRMCVYQCVPKSHMSSYVTISIISSP